MSRPTFDPLCQASGGVDLPLPPQLLCLRSASGTRVEFADDIQAQCAIGGLWGAILGYESLDQVPALTKKTPEPGPPADPGRVDEAAAELCSLFGPRYHKAFLFPSQQQGLDFAAKLARDTSTEEHGRPRPLMAVAGSGYDQLGEFRLHLSVVSTVEREIIHSYDSGGRNYLADLDNLFGHFAERLSAFVVAPSMGFGTAPMPTADTLAIIERSQDAGCLVIADETWSGMMRSGLMSASSQWSVPPDMMIVSGGVTNGRDNTSLVLVGSRPRSQAPKLSGADDGRSTSIQSLSAVIATTTQLADLAFQEASLATATVLGHGLKKLVELGICRSLSGSGWAYSLGLNSGPQQWRRSEAMVASEFIRREQVWVCPRSDGRLLVLPPVVSSDSDVVRMLDGIEVGLRNWATLL